MNELLIAIHEQYIKLRCGVGRVRTELVEVDTPASAEQLEQASDRHDKPIDDVRRLGAPAHSPNCRKRASA